MNGKREYDLRDQERREQAANVRVGALCRVEKFDPAAMRVDVQPLSKALDAGVYRTQPQILSVPVALVRFLALSLCIHLHGDNHFDA